MFTRLIFLSTFCLISPLAYAQASETPKYNPCQDLYLGQQSIPSALKKHLGDWDSCEVERYARGTFGLDALLILRWPNVNLSLEYQPPETGIYVVNITGESPFDAAWYKENRESLISDGFDMDWHFDGFLGPTSEHYMSKDDGTNAQLWVERDMDGNVTWMRFSYAL